MEAGGEGGDDGWPDRTGAVASWPTEHGFSNRKVRERERATAGSPRVTSVTEKEQGGRGTR